MAKFCTNCGSPIEEGQAKCQYCGKILDPSKVNEESTVNTATEQAYQQTYQQNTASTAATGGNTNAKSKIAAGLLGVFLGAFGVHNFYLGYTGKGVAQLLITVCSCCILSEVTAIWGLIEGILILTGNINKDAQGNPLVD